VTVAPRGNRHGVGRAGSPAADRAASDPGTADLRVTLHAQLVARIDFARAEQLDQAQLAAECRALLHSLVEQLDRRMSDAERDTLIQGVLDDAFALGPLEPLLADPGIADVLVLAPDRVFIERSGRLIETDARFRDAQHLLHVIQRLVRNAGRRIDERSPMVDARLPDGSRVNAIIPPLAVDGPQLSIRKFPARALQLEDLVALGTLAPATADLLRAAVAGRLNIVLSGGAGAGKTTLLNAMSACIGPEERVITIEDAAELRLGGRHIVRLETRAANVEGVGAVHARDLLRNALRMRPDRIIVGECRAAETYDMMQAMNTGHEGSMTTLHANSARDTVIRLESLLAMGGFDVPVRVLRDYVASAIDLVVHLSRLPDGRRVVSEVAELRGSGDSGADLQPIHVFEIGGISGGTVDGQFRATGVRPAFLPRLAARGIALEESMFAAGPLAAGSASR
jgi:pilus assembly protein CpaF